MVELSVGAKVVGEIHRPGLSVAIERRDLARVGRINKVRHSSRVSESLWGTPDGYSVIVLYDGYNMLITDYHRSKMDDGSNCGCTVAQLSTGWHEISHQSNNKQEKKTRDENDHRRSQTDIQEMNGCPEASAHPLLRAQTD